MAVVNATGYIARKPRRKRPKCLGSRKSASISTTAQNINQERRLTKGLPSAALTESRMDRAILPQSDPELTGVFATANILSSKSLYLASQAFTFWMAFRTSELSDRFAKSRT